ncbi:acetyltransferase (GNAT) family protein [Mucilaginibacter gracilis]|uniref:Acetyltransferase (GNAT) family protein n=1 Tax=Mucilaginibacter gracilis TaxID=423350 RepID=A0A495J6F6_9SPHI|nr:GNAT family N-acetyltransferase [Mucilaginibacter gracilis]RKR84291.1 acetyltransferase (GNAT) family protein [Mucilaginibacter gracilis]
MKMRKDMRSAMRTDKPLVTDLLSAAFDDNLSVNYSVRQDDKRKQRIRALMDYSFEVCYRFGKVWLSEDRKACVLLLYPHQKKTDLKAIWLDLILIVKAIGLGGIKKAVDREAKIKSKQPNEPIVYLWFIGVAPLYQHQGTGSRLLKQVIAAAKLQNLPVFLETSTERNLPWYKRYGFNEYDSLELGYTLHFLKYEHIK